MRTVQGLVEEIRQRNEALRKTADKMDEYGRNESDLDGGTLKSIRRQTAEIEDLGRELEESRGSHLINPMSLFFKGQSLYRSPGVELMNDGNFKSAIDRFGLKYGQSKGMPVGVIGPWDVPLSYGGMKSVAPITSATANPGPIVRPDRTSLIDPGPFQRPLTIMDLLTTLETSSDSVEYTRVTSFTNSASPVGEATTVVSGQAGQSSLTLSLETVEVKTIPHFMAVSRRILNDAPYLRSVIDNFLMYGVNEEIEDQVVAGSGTGSNMTGYLNWSGVGSQAYDTNIIRTARKARTKVRTEGRGRATAYVFNPIDWESFDLSVDSEGRYMFGGPTVLGVSRLWGLPVVECEAQPQGTGEVADFRLANFWNHVGSAQFFLSDSHEDYFTRGLLALLLEKRAAFAVTRPEAFIEIDLTA